MPSTPPPLLLKCCWPKDKSYGYDIMGGKEHRAPGGQGCLGGEEDILFQKSKESSSICSPHLHDNCVELWQTSKRASQLQGTYREDKDAENLRSKKLPISRYCEKKVKPFIFVLFLKWGLSVQHWLAWNSLPSPSQLQTQQRLACLYFLKDNVLKEKIKNANTPKNFCKIVYRTKTGL